MVRDVKDLFKDIFPKYVEHNALVCDSLYIANRFEKRHSSVLRSIDVIRERLSEIGVDYQSIYMLLEYADASGKKNKRYLLTRDGFFLLVMGFTGKKALAWKCEVLRVFNELAMW